MCAIYLFIGELCNMKQNHERKHTQRERKTVNHVEERGIGRDRINFHNTQKSYKKTIQRKGEGEREKQKPKTIQRKGDGERMRFQHIKENHAKKGKGKRETKIEKHTERGGGRFPHRLFEFSPKSSVLFLFFSTFFSFRFHLFIFSLCTFFLSVIGRSRSFGIPERSSGLSKPQIHSFTFMSLRSNSDERTTNAEEIRG